MQLGTLRNALFIQLQPKRRLSEDSALYQIAQEACAGVEVASKSFASLMYWLQGQEKQPLYTILPMLGRTLFFQNYIIVLHWVELGYFEITSLFCC